MKAAVLEEPNNLVLRGTKDPALVPGDLVIRMRSATICGTDIRIFRGRKTMGVRYPSILGHEFAGEIVDTGGRSGFSIGDRIGICPAIPCGHCHRCKRGAENLCSEGMNFGYEIDGGFAELVRIPAKAVDGGNVRRLPDGMTFGEAAMIEPLSCVLNGQEQVNLGFGDVVVIIGAGPIGLLHVLLARLRGAVRIIVSDPNAPRREAALSYGADTTIDPTTEDVAARVRAETDGRGADVVICAIGIPALARQATELAAHSGRISLFAGFSKGDTSQMDINAIHYNQITVTGAFGLSRRNFDDAFNIVASGRLDVAPLITGRFPLEETLRAFEVAESGAAIKVAVEND
ncbi:zinc-dependent dehydrogenase [Alexandriicola marinus]|uniref:zinc-dependent dehydrogenase n=1 Tax=Alexandriicola marinus TaxID=2081710 RepID=UPI000FDB17B7|nr:zinc-dependent dehydrogenase [Alexandriicola marinus]